MSLNLPIDFDYNIYRIHTDLSTFNNESLKLIFVKVNRLLLDSEEYIIISLIRNPLTDVTIKLLVKTINIYILIYYNKLINNITYIKYYIKYIILTFLSKIILYDNMNII